MLHLPAEQIADCLSDLNVEAGMLAMHTPHVSVGGDIRGPFHRTVRVLTLSSDLLLVSSLLVLFPQAHSAKKTITERQQS